MRSWFNRNPEIAPLPFVLIIVFLIMSVLTSGKFFRIGNIQSMAFQLPELGIFSLAMMITLLSGGLNLSVISTANLSSILTALILRHLSIPGDRGVMITLIIMLAISIAIISALFLGFINGFLIAIIGVSPILATLGTMTLYDGLAIAITKGYVISDFPKGFLFIGNGTILGIPISILIFVICAYVMAVILNRKPYGLSVYMLGSNPIATEYSGIDVKNILINTYLISGFLSGIASVIMTSRFNSANAGYGASYLLITVLIAVLGGVNPFGGFGKISGLIMALIILQFLSSGLNLLGVTAFVTISLWGIILILVMGLNHFIYKRKIIRISKQLVKYFILVQSFLGSFPRH
jgi:ribose/xylose/arabinose/galactoside ABC-type transport system permease subunit